MTFLDVLPYRQHKDKSAQIPAHPRFTRMYGVTHSIAFQAILYIQNLNQLGKAPSFTVKTYIFIVFR